MADIILRINTPVTITNVDQGALFSEHFCDLVRAKKLCAMPDPFLKRVMALRRIE